MYDVDKIGKSRGPIRRATPHNISHPLFFCNRMSHLQSVEANRKAFSSDLTDAYDGKSSISTLTTLFALSLLEFDVAAPRKTPEQTEQAIEAAEINDRYAELTKKLQPGATIIDFACGTGLVAEKLAPFMKGEVVGIDLSDTMLAKFDARSKQLTEKYPGFHMRSLCGDITESSFDVEPLKQYADILICTLAFHHIHAYYEVSQVLKSLVKPGGWIFIYDFYNEDLENTKLVHGGAHNDHGVAHHGLTIAEMNRCFADGCVNVSSAREFKVRVWQDEKFIQSHCTESVVEKLHKAPKKGDLYLVDCSVILGVAQVAPA